MTKEGLDDLTIATWGIVMSGYHPPIEEMMFTLQEIVGLEKLDGHPKAEDVSDELTRAILEEAGKLARDEIAPLNHSGDQQGAVRRQDGRIETATGFAKAYAAMAEGGWTAIEGSDAYGGQNLPGLVATPVNEMWQSANMGFALCHLLTQGLVYALQKNASAAQKQTYLPPMIAGRWTGTMNLTEPQAGTDLAAIKTLAVKEGDHYRITGQKIYITYGEHDMAENIVHFVLARCEGAPEGVKGISVFIVPKFLPDENGNPGQPNDLKCLSIEKKLGIKGSPTCVMQYGEEGGAIGYLVGAENDGLKLMFSMMNHARFAVGLQGLALSERAFQQALSYAHDRVQGQPLGADKGASIIEHPDVLRMLGLMQAEIDGMRALAYQGALMLDLAEADAEKAEAAALLVPIIKGWLTERSVALTSDAVQIHGGMGFIEETGAAQHFRDSRILPIYEGTTAIQANDLMFRKTLRDGGAGISTLLDEISQEASTWDKAAGDALNESITACRSALTYLLDNQSDARLVAAAGVDWVMMLGVVFGGWLMGRAEHKARQLADTGKYGSEFLAARQQSCVIYRNQILPKAHLHAANITQGAKASMGMQSDWLGRA